MPGLAVKSMVVADRYIMLLDNCDKVAQGVFYPLPVEHKQTWRQPVTQMELLKQVQHGSSVK